MSAVYIDKAPDVTLLFSAAKMVGWMAAFTGGIPTPETHNEWALREPMNKKLAVSRSLQIIDLIDLI